MIVLRIRILDASTEEYQEEEEAYSQGEEDQFDQYHHQGKLIHLLSAKLSRAMHHPLFTLCLVVLSQFLLYKFYRFIFKVLLIHGSLGLE